LGFGEVYPTNSGDESGLAAGTDEITTKVNAENIVEISVSDTGIGISKEKMEKLFETGEKAGTPGTEGEPSTGLGLLLCKEFVELNGGSIWFESEVGKGSTFSFSIPVEVKN